MITKNEFLFLFYKSTAPRAQGVQEKTVVKFQTSGRLAWVGVKEGDVHSS